MILQHVVGVFDGVPARGSSNERASSTYALQALRGPTDCRRSAALQSWVQITDLLAKIGFDTPQCGIPSFLPRSSPPELGNLWHVSSVFFHGASCAAGGDGWLLGRSRSSRAPRRRSSKYRRTRTARRVGWAACATNKLEM